VQKFPKERKSFFKFFDRHASRSETNIPIDPENDLLERCLLKRNLGKNSDQSRSSSPRIAGA